MPELPEVETIRRSMLSLQGVCVGGIQIERADIIREQAFAPELLIGQAWQAVERRGKFLSFIFAADRVMTVHLGMSGRFYIASALPEEKHIHLVIRLEDGSLLIYQDPRRFGGIWFTSGPSGNVAALGVEPLEAAFSAAYLRQTLKGRKAAVKNLLLNQRLIAGLGNIYADEALFAAGILPDRPGGDLKAAEIRRLRQAIVQVLTDSITARGTTFRDYRDGWNQAGSFQQQLKVYGRDGKPCALCGTVIQMVRIGGRSSHYCTGCQR
jgi:formamidopyrimidine-DNA glycosylase